MNRFSRDAKALRSGARCPLIMWPIASRLNVTDPQSVNEISCKEDFFCTRLRFAVLYDKVNCVENELACDGLTRMGVSERLCFWSSISEIG